MSRPAPADVLTHDERVHEIVTGEAVSLDLRPTSFVLRAAGSAIDLVVYLGGYGVLIWVLLSTVRVDEAMQQALVISTLVIAVVVVPTAVETLSRGKSLGRLAVGSRIVRDDGGSIGFRHAFIRALTGVLENILTFGSLAALVGMLDSRSRRIGDILAGTYGQYERVPALRSAPVAVPAPLEQWALTSDVGRMPDPLSRRIAQFLAQASGMSPVSRSGLAHSLLVEASPWIAPLPHAEPEQVLLAVAALRRDREYAALVTQSGRIAALAPELQAAPHGFPADRG